MGLLDDAIREHLDLKRRRGADPAEIEYAEREALGPVRRAPEELAEEQHAPPMHPDDGPEYDHGEEPYEEEYDVLPEAGHLEPPPPAYEEPALEPEPPAPAYEEPAHEEPAGEHEPSPVHEPLEQEPLAPHRAPEPPPDHHAVNRETEEYEIEHDDPEGEDMLEETPEFLQETPEHDRLWFEQRPPRDFDFDG